MGDLLIFLPFLALFGAIIYMQTRQRKKMLARQTELQSALQLGAHIMLTCGLHGEVAGLADDTVDVEIAPGVVATFARAAVMEVRGAEPTDSTDADDDVEDIDDVDDEFDGDFDDVEPDTDDVARPEKSAGSPAATSTKRASDDPSA